MHEAYCRRNSLSNLTRTYILGTPGYLYVGQKSHLTTCECDQVRVFILMIVMLLLLTAVHPIANELAGTTNEKMQNVVRWSMYLCGSIYVCTATFGYLLFGEGTSEDILSNFDTDLGVPMSELICVVVRISYAVHIMLVYPLLNFSLRLNLDAILFPRATALAHDSVRFWLITAFLLCTVFLGAAVVPSIWIAFQFTGATCTVCLGFIFPALVLLKYVPPLPPVLLHIRSNNDYRLIYNIARRDKALLATKKDKVEAAVMVTLAIVSSVVAVTTDIFNLVEPGKSPGGLTSSFL